MNVLVTGGAGFIGSHIVERFIATGLQVAVLDDLSTGRVAHVPDGVPLYRIDLTAADEAALDAAFAEVGPEVVVHHAAQADVGRSVSDPVHDAQVNVVGTIRLLQAAVRHGVRKVVYASSAAIYGEPVHLPITEDHPVRPVSPYGISKYTVEHYLEAYRELFGLHYTVLRYANVYGPRQGASGEGGVISIFADHLARGVAPKVFGDGEQTRDFVYVGDVAEANRLALGSGASDDAVIQVSTGSEVTVNQLYRELLNVSGQSVEPVYEPARPGDIVRSVLDNRRACDLLGWEPKVSLAEGLERTYASVAAQRAELGSETESGAKDADERGRKGA